jgi:hypothetical protein
VTLTFSLALTVIDPASGGSDDVLVRGNAEQTVAELAQRLAAYFGLAQAAYGLRVERTAEQLRLDAPLSSVDLLEGDTVTLLLPRASERRRPRWASDESAVIELRPRRS